VIAEYLARLTARWFIRPEFQNAGGKWTVRTANAASPDPARPTIEDANLCFHKVNAFVIEINRRLGALP
jgi:hypothetical protein